MNQEVFKSRFLIGIIIPILMEFAVFQTYLFFSQAEPSLEIFYPLFLTVVPVALFYLKVPNLIFRIAKIGNFYGKAVEENIDQILDEENELSVENKQKIETALKAKLIPKLVFQLKQDYNESFFKNRKSESESILSLYESVFLFAVITLIFNTTNILGTIYLHYSSINLWILKIDRITDISNIVIFLSVFLLLTLSSIFLLKTSCNQIVRIIPRTIPILAKWEDDLNTQKRLERIIAFNSLPPIIPKQIKYNKSAMLSLYKQIILPDLVESIEWYLREKTGKQIAWKQYSELLDDFELTQKQRESLETKFLQTPLIQIAEKLSFDTREFESITEDFTYVRNSIEDWESLSTAEKGIAFLFLYRSAETLTRNLLRRFQIEPDDWTLLLMLKSLLQSKIINENEFGAIDAFRRKRNVFLHASGKSINIEKSEISAIIDILEKILIRVDKKL